jgi:hypothetical protein
MVATERPRHRLCQLVADERHGAVSVLAVCRRGLGAGLSPSGALSLAMARFHQATRDEAIAALSAITDPADRATATGRLSNAPQHGAFSHPYLGGAMAIHSLL